MGVWGKTVGVSVCLGNGAKAAGQGFSRGPMMPSAKTEKLELRKGEEKGKKHGGGGLHRYWKVLEKETVVFEKRGGGKRTASKKG